MSMAVSPRSRFDSIRALSQIAKEDWHEMHIRVKIDSKLNRQSFQQGSENGAVDVKSNGRYWIRTSDFHRVKMAL